MHEPRQPDSKLPVQSALAYAKRNLDKPLTVGQLAEAAHPSPRQQREAAVPPGATGCGVSDYQRVGEDWDHFAYVSWNLVFKPREFIYQSNVDYWPFWEAIGISLLWAPCFRASSA